MAVISALLEKGAQLKIYEPQATNTARKFFNNSDPAITYAADMYEAADGAEALIIHTDWTMFRTPDFERLKSRLKNPVIFDGRNLYSHDKLTNMGFDYFLYNGRNPPPVTTISY